MIINNKRYTGYQTYKEKGKEDYLLVDLNNINSSGNIEGLSAALSEKVSSLCVSGVSSDYLSEKCRAVSWAKVPTEWQQAFAQRMDIDLTENNTRKNKIK